MGKLSQYSRNRIISLHASNISIVNIVKILEQEGVKTSRNSVSSFIMRYKRTRRINDAQRSGRKGNISQDDINFIDEKMKQNDELTSAKLQKLLKDERNVSVSASIIRYSRRKLEWKHERSRYCQLIRNV